MLIYVTCFLKSQYKRNFSNMSARWKFLVISLPAPYKSFLTLHKRQKSSTIFWLNLLVFLPTLEISIKFQNKCLPFTNWHVFTTFVWGCSIDKSKPVKIKHRLVLIWIKLILQYSLTTYISIYCITFSEQCFIYKEQNQNFNVPKVCSRMFSFVTNWWVCSM